MSKMDTQFHEKVLLTLPGLKVFTLITNAQAVTGVYTEVYWQNTYTHAINGPFQSVYHAMTHYRDALKVIGQVPPPTVVDTIANVIHIDFKIRKRVV